MNSIQLELFPQEVIRIGVNPKRAIISFDFEGKQAWAPFRAMPLLIRIIKKRESGTAGTAGEISQGLSSQDFLYRKFLCTVGTWERLSQYSDFSTSIPPCYVV